MTVSDTCLGIYELLETILFNLPPTDITRSMYVSAIWKHIIEKSQRLQRARIIFPHPTTVTDNHRKWLLEGIPAYPQSAMLELNSYLISKCSAKDTQTWLRKAHKNSLLRHKQELATFPPCEKMQLETWMARTVCTVYVQGEIRVKDLLELSAKLQRTERKMRADLFERNSEDTVARSVGCVID